MKAVFAITGMVFLLSNSFAGLLGYWNFDEASGSIALDRGGTNNAIIYNGTYIPGRFGSSALHLNGTSTFILVGAERSRLTLTNTPYSIVWWQRWAGQTTSPIQRIVNMDDGLDVTGGYAAFLFSGALAASHNNGTDQNWFTSVRPGLAVWEFYAIVYDGGQRHLYKDGQLLGSTPTGPRPAK